MIRPCTLPRLCLAILITMPVAAAPVFAARPNVLLIVSDDQRPDTIHALGNERIETPNLDRLVTEGCAFTRATCGNPICTPSRAEILTGSCSFRNEDGFLWQLQTAVPDYPEAQTEMQWHSKRIWPGARWNSGCCTNSLGFTSH